MSRADEKEELKKLQLKMLRIQQAVWEKKERVIIAIEGFDAAGKGWVIRRITGPMDPRGVRVHPIGPPSSEDQGKHYLFRFWSDLPARGIIAVFDRTWYGRVLVERVEELIPKKRWEEAYHEIKEFEKTLTHDGIHLIKIFLKISHEEQYRRFEDRLNDPYKFWKITDADIEARKKWKDYVKAAKDMVRLTSTKKSPWHVVETDDKHAARKEVLEIIIRELGSLEKWMEKAAVQKDRKELARELKKLR